MLGAMVVGMLAGLVTGFFHTKCGIPAILSGILTQLGLWSVNLAIMGMKANQALSVKNYKELALALDRAFAEQEMMGQKANDYVQSELGATNKILRHLNF
jgi:ABC-type uncharacterized transport system permease subunit